MQRTPQRCPDCSQPLGISWDMWGQYYVCQGCGFTAEGDEMKPTDKRQEVSAFLVAAGAGMERQALHGRSRRDSQPGRSIPRSLLSRMPADSAAPAPASFFVPASALPTLRRGTASGAKSRRPA